MHFLFIPIRKQESVLLSRAILVLLFLLLPIGCSPTSSSSRVAPPSVPSDLRIVIGEGGGITGLWSGYSILAGDTLLTWKGQSMGENPTFAGRFPHDTVLALWETIRGLHLLDQASHSIHANYIQVLSISVGGSEHGFSWEPSFAEDSTVAVARGFRTRCLRAVHASLGN